MKSEGSIGKSPREPSPELNYALILILEFQPQEQTFLFESSLWYEITAKAD
jgi:hypothetical protein